MAEVSIFYQGRKAFLSFNSAVAGHHLAGLAPHTGFFAYVKLKQPLVTETYVSEREAEEYVTENLRTEGNREVHPTRVRYLLCEGIGERLAGQVLCEGDSIKWRRLDGAAYYYYGFRLYNPTERLSEWLVGRGFNCSVEYLRDYIRQTDWVKLDTSTGPTPIYPDR
ncbi:MAG: hypothetical protein KOO62_05900 [candidate division Zixibacteria bacterium]|nr:hypothetical protein [candidate division Zixibacteria bacterium]